MKQETRICQNCKSEFIIEKEDFNFYEKIKVPPPTFCPECRFQRRLAIRNNRVFYRSECTLCQSNILSLYNKNSPYTIYCRDCWLSDQWDPISYGKDYDFSRPFFEQFHELQKAVPRVNLYRDNFVSSDYCNYGLDFKECYLLFGGKNNERIYFGNQVLDSRDSMDVDFSEGVEFSYENFECARVNKLFFSEYSQDCLESYFLADCRNCMNCFGCVGMVNTQYHILNQPIAKEKYEAFVKDIQGSYKKLSEFLEKFKELKLAVPRRFARIYKSVNSDGDDLLEGRNTHSSFSTRQAEDSKFLFFCRKKSKDCYDCSFQGYGAELLYEIAHGFSGSNTAFSFRNLHNRDSQYNEECHECSHVFGCEGLRNKKYCILNKQYTQEEYEEMMPKILKQMKEIPYSDIQGRIFKYGEFFPSDLSPFAYNETIAQEYFPLDKKEAIEKGYKWEDSEKRNYKIDIENEDIPDNIKYIGDDIINKVIACKHGGKCTEQCTEAFKIVPEEFKFYKRMNLPLPRLCPNCRHFQRLALRNPMKLWERQCMKRGCENIFKTTYAPDRPEIIYCEKCYQKEVY